MGSAGAAECVGCEAGTCEAEGSVSGGDCLPCEAGKTSGASSATSTVCPGGSYDDAAGAAECTKCEAGTCSEAEGSVSGGDCVPCQAGKVSAAGASFCWDPTHGRPRMEFLWMRRRGSRLSRLGARGNTHERGCVHHRGGRLRRQQRLRGPGRLGVGGRAHDRSVRGFGVGGLPRHHRVVRMWHGAALGELQVQAFYTIEGRSEGEMVVRVDGTGWMANFNSKTRRTADMNCPSRSSTPDLVRWRRCALGESSPRSGHASGRWGGESPPRRACGFRKTYLLAGRRKCPPPSTTSPTLTESTA